MIFPDDVAIDFELFGCFKFSIHLTQIKIKFIRNSIDNKFFFSECHTKFYKDESKGQLKTNEN